MKHIFFALAIAIASSTLLTNNSNAQCYLGINPEHMPSPINKQWDSTPRHYSGYFGEPVKKISFKTSQATINNNDPQGSDKLYSAGLSGMYFQNDRFYPVDKSSLNNEKVVDYSNLSAEEFLLMTLGTRPAVWYITRMSVVSK